MEERDYLRREAEVNGRAFKHQVREEEVGEGPVLEPDAVQGRDPSPVETSLLPLEGYRGSLGVARAREMSAGRKTLSPRCT